MDRDLLKDAIDHLEIAVRQYPDHPRYLAALGEAWLLRGDAAAALAPLERSVSFDRHPRVTCLMALALLRLDRPQDAERFADAAIEEAPFFHRAWFVRAQSRINGGRKLPAADDLRQARRLEPDQCIYSLRLAALLIDMAWLGDGADVRTLMLQESLALLADSKARARAAKVSSRMAETWTYLRGCLEVDVGDPQEAVALFKLLKWPHSHECAYRRGLAYAAVGDRESARVAFELAQSDPDLREEVHQRLLALAQANAGRLHWLSRIPRVDLLETHALGPTEVLGMRRGQLSPSDGGAHASPSDHELSDSSSTPPPYQPNSGTTPNPYS